MTPQQTLDALKLKYTDGRVIPVHRCSVCNYQCGYFWRDGMLFYDAGCNCMAVMDVSPRPESLLLKKIERDHAWVRRVLGDAVAV